MANVLESLLKSVNREKLEEIKKKAENGELGEMLSQVDKQKAEQMIKSFGLSEQTKNVDLEKVLEQAKKNPELLKNLKNML